MDSRGRTRPMPQNEPIAIIGTACRFAGESNSPSQFWDLLRNPTDLVQSIPGDRFSKEGFYHPDPQYHGHHNVPFSYFLSGNVRHFDSQFFGIKPIEASATDPQQRLLLEVVYEGIDAAGLVFDDLRGTNTAVYVGLMSSDYDTMVSRDTDGIPAYHASGTARSILSNRISYFFDWRGPSMTIDTACSSSLVAVHHAVQALRNGEAPVAVAAGTNLILGPEAFISESKLRMLSPDGRSRMWDVGANGYARGEGIAAIVLKTLSDAIRDGDPIECLVVETGINQDGRTKGITVPSAIAQTTLIKDTYRRAGLDPRKEEDRCQYFEAHGTGTPAGDPIEAEAIHNAFFGDMEKINGPEHPKMLVGSVKSVIGHTEGTAGLAGVIKASLALQNGMIPSNLHFTKLNPAITPFYNRLKVPTALVKWPEKPCSLPRRASVNSFGFGGTNAHAILEGYDREDVSTTLSTNRSQDSVLPFIFSSHSENSLLKLLQSYSKFLHSRPDCSLRELAFTLLARKSQWQFTAIFYAKSVLELFSKMNAYIHSGSLPSNLVSHVKSRSISRSGRILGIFTGQGAQWAEMGRELLLQSEFARSSLSKFDHWLSELPSSDRPSWLFQHELMKEPDVSRINEPEIAQPACTAMQILLVDILRHAGLEFHAVVGHSSGEIAAAYAAGFLTSRNAIYVAYYRGFYAKLSQGTARKPGKMLAVGTTLEDVTDLCQLPYFRGRISVAANNSVSSVTLSGDEDRIEQAKLVFEDEEKFVRMLKVQSAYHSHHMQPCEKPYLDAMRRELVHRPGEDLLPAGSTWISSVTGDIVAHGNHALPAEYWIQNMLQPVLFREAISTTVLECGPFDLTVEIGPHPALRAPVLQTFQESGDKPIPYTATLKRGIGDIEALAESLGHLWAHLPRQIDLGKYDALMTGLTGFHILRGLPVYCWNHEREYWQESRQSRTFRSRGPLHELLGHLSNDSTDQLYRWRHILRVKELPWLQGHKIQGQTVFPAAGYAVTALDAAVAITGHKHVGTIEIEDLTIAQALTFPEEDSGVEVLFTIVRIVRSTEDSWEGSFMYHAALAKDRDEFTLLAKGRLSVALCPANLSSDVRNPPEAGLREVGVDQFYNALLQVGYEYSGPFKALSAMNRKLGWATGHVTCPGPIAPSKAYTIHPGTLDATLQSVFLAHCYPEDGTLWSLHVPTSIGRIALDLTALNSLHTYPSKFPFDAFATRDREMALSGDVDVFAPDGESLVLRIEGITCMPFSPASANDDRKIFSFEAWGIAYPDATLASLDQSVTQEQHNLALALERLSYFYMRKIQASVPEDHLARSSSPYRHYFAYIRDILSNAPTDKHRHIRREWQNDTDQTLAALVLKYEHVTDLQVVRAVGEHIVRVMNGETTILEHLMKDNLLSRHYSEGLEFSRHNVYLARAVNQIAYRYPHMNILEIGAGTGGATRHILKCIGSRFRRYVFTDISKGYFDSAKEHFAQHPGRVTFKVLDIELDPSQQGFEDASFDLIIASNVIHATKKLKRTLHNVRRLLKPGGYLALLEITNNGPIRNGFVFGSLHGWWLGVDDGRTRSPCIEPAKWHDMLQSTGFSGVDTITPQTNLLAYPGSVIISQAIDDRIEFLRQPLSFEPGRVGLGHIASRLIIIGGATCLLGEDRKRLEDSLRPFFDQVLAIDSIAQLSSLEKGVHTVVLSITELDHPLFQDIKDDAFQGMKDMFDLSNTVVWVTQGCYVDNPYASMTVGFGRSHLQETPNVHLQFLDFEAKADISAKILAKELLRCCAQVNWESFLKEECLWSVEPELTVRDGKLMVPRILENIEQNNRHNSARRPIFEDINPCETTVALVAGEEAYELEQVSLSASQSYGFATDAVTITATLSVLPAIRLTNSISLFVIYGIDQASHVPTVCFTDSAASTVQVPRAWTFPCSTPTEELPEHLARLACNLAALGILENLSSGGILVVLEPPTLFAETLHCRAMQRNIRVRCISTGNMSNTSNDFPCQVIPSYRSLRQINEVLSLSPHLFLDFARSPEAIKMSNLAQKQLPLYCKRETPGSLFSFTANVPLQTNDKINHVLKIAKESTEIDIQTITNKPLLNIITPEEATATPRRLDSLSLVKWDQSSLPVRIHPVDSFPLFRQDKTYWLVGLTQTLGLSLCEWMIQNGAKHIVLTSRNPKIDERWLGKMAPRGANIKFYANDVCDKQGLERTHQDIRRTMPPTAGVAHGAMVLRDAFAKDMTLSHFHSVTDPKVKGAIHLDEIFNTNDLDFFIFFSSMAAVTGNLGQCNYTAANTFLSGLVEKRRQRGLAASVIHIGAILGAGYITHQMTTVFLEKLLEGGHTRMSEQVFHQIFAEGVLASNPKSTKPSQIYTGLRYTSESDPMKPFWYHNPRFSNQILEDDSLDFSAESDNRNNVAIATLLSRVTSRDEMQRILEDHFLAKLRNILQSDDDSSWNRDAMLDQHLDSLGIDSLIAVEIRTWFLKSAAINVPVLKILGGLTIRELLEFAMEKLSQNKRVEPHDSESTAREADLRGDTSDTGPVTSGSESENNATSERSFTGDNEFDSIPPEKFGISPRMDIKASPLSFVKTAPISYTQAMFWFVSVYLEDRTSLNHSGAYRITGDLRIGNLEDAVRSVAQLHEILRTCFVRGPDGSILQGILERSRLSLETGDVESESHAMRELDLMKNTDFELESGQTMRIMLLSQSQKEHYLLISAHPIVLDGTSLQIFMADLEIAYDGNSPARVLQFGEFASAQRTQYRGHKWAEEVMFWSKELTPIPEPLNLFPCAKVKARRNLISYTVHRSDYRIDTTLNASVRKFSTRYRVTPFQFYVTIFRILLLRFSGDRALCIGTAVANRSGVYAAGASALGPYMNLLPVMFSGINDGSILQVLQNTKKKILSSIANSALPFEEILHSVGVNRSASHSPLFQAFIDYRQGAKENQPFSDCELQVVNFDTGRNGYDVGLDIVDTAGGECWLMLTTQKSLYGPDEADLIMSSFIHLIKSVIDHPGQSAKDVDIYAPETRKVALKFGKGPVCKSTWPNTLIHQVENIASVFPDEFAVKDGYGNHLTYMQLQARVASISAALLSHKIQERDPVAVFQEPSADLICSILAIFRIGAVYVPLDTEMPHARLAQIASDSRVRSVLIDQSIAPNVDGLVAELEDVIIILDISSLPVRAQPPPISASPYAPATILYTSGTTGVPKGIVLTHTNLKNEIEFSALSYRLKREIVLQQSSPAFDMSLTQIFSALAFGGSLLIVPKSLRKDPLALAELISSGNITLTAATPSEYMKWLNASQELRLRSSSWRVAISGGEKFSEALAARFRDLHNHGLRVYNAYGPTETTCSAIRSMVSLEEEVKGLPIAAGSPAPNTTIFILDENLATVPIGVPGEIFIGGAGVALGYLDDQQTAKAFIPNPLESRLTEEDRNVLYRTGDVGRWLQNGSVLIEGRTADDAQIKLRGLRIELEEIETAILLAGHGEFEEVAVGVRQAETDSADFLVAYIIFSQPTHADVSNALRSLNSKLPLPQYMHPAMIVPVSSLPSGASGKVDRNALNHYPLPQIRSKISGDFTGTEEILLGIWVDVLPALSASTLGSSTDFFQIGGNSLLLVNVQSKIQERFKKKIPLFRLFENSTLKEMASALADSPQSVESGWDWEAESSVPPDYFDETTSATISQSREDFKTVILTGASGFLGQGILNGLIQTPAVSIIHCIAVRDVSALHKFKDDPKVRIHHGELTQSHFGLDTGFLVSLFQHADVVIHNAADASHLKSFSALKEVNLESTKHLLRLCLPGKTPFHFISTAGVALLGELEELGEISVATYKPPADGSDGYTTTKWCSERFIENVSLHYGIRTWIHRPSSIFREGDPGLDILQNLLKYMEMTAAVPKFDQIQGFFDVVNLTTVVNRIIVSLGRDTQQLVNYVNHSGDIQVQFENLEEFISERYSRKFATIDMDTWISKAEEMGMTSLLAAVLRKMMNKGKKIRFPRLLKSEL